MGVVLEACASGGIRTAVFVWLVGAGVAVGVGAALVLSSSIRRPTRRLAQQVIRPIFSRGI